VRTRNYTEIQAAVRTGIAAGFGTEKIYSHRVKIIHRVLWGVGTAADIVRFPLGDFEAQAAHVVASLPATVVREGRLLYDARGIAA
jgi:hypothetical protein